MIMKKIEDTTENWENGALGRDEEFVAQSDLDQSELDNLLRMQPVSIRFQKSLLEELKTIADYYGIGYQTLIKQVLQRFTIAEMKQMARQLADNQKTEDEKPEPTKVKAC